MKTFFTPARIWPDQRRLWHVYYLPDPASLAPLLDAYDATLHGETALAPVQRIWLHATFVKIFPPTGAVSTTQRHGLITQLRQRCAALAPIPLVAGPAMATASAVVLDLTPDHAWNQLRTAIATIIDEVLGPGSAVISPTERPHITLAYGTGDTDSGALQSQLRHATDQRIPLTITEIDLVDVTQDLQTHEYRWDRIAAVALGRTTLRSATSTAATTVTSGVADEP